MQNGALLIIKINMTDVKYRCIVCNYIYDPSEGDSINGIKPGTTFDELPDDWICPICGASKAEFVIFDDF
jgi:rubredoxin